MWQELAAIAVLSGKTPPAVGDGRVGFGLLCGADSLREAECALGASLAPSLAGLRLWFCCIWKAVCIWKAMRSAAFGRWCFRTVFLEWNACRLPYAPERLGACAQLGAQGRPPFLEETIAASNWHLPACAVTLGGMLC